MSGAAFRFLAVFTGDLLDLEAGPCEPELRQRATDWVLARIGGAAQPARLGLVATTLLIAAALQVSARGAYEQLPDERRRALARKLIDTRLPLVSDWVRAVRALALSYYFEARAGYIG